MEEVKQNTNQNKSIEAGQEMYQTITTLSKTPSISENQMANLTAAAK